MQMHRCLTWEIAQYLYLQAANNTTAPQFRVTAAPWLTATAAITPWTIWHIETGEPGSIPGVQYPYREPIVFTNDGGTYSSLGYDPTGLGQYQPSVGRLFSGDDPTSNSDDEFAVHPCLRYDDGHSSAIVEGTRYRNQIRFAWSHTAIDSNMYPFGTIGTDGEYIYEFSRPLVTNENTDAQFQVGQTASFGFAFWIPPAIGEEWEDANHYVAPPGLQFGTVQLLSPPAADNDSDDDDSSTAATKLNLAMLLFTALIIAVAAF